MQYILKNKDKNVLEFEVENVETKSRVTNTTETIQKLTKIKVIESKLFPKNLSIDDLERNLELWIKNRKVPQNREFVENIIATYSINGKEQLILLIIFLQLYPILSSYCTHSFGLVLNICISSGVISNFI